MVFNSIALFSWEWGIVGAIILGLVFLSLVIATVVFLTKGKKR